MAGLLQAIINKKPEVALVNFPENALFKLSCITGSLDLYDCFMEVGIEPFLKSKDEDFIFDYATELSLVAHEINDNFFPQYVKCIKGIDFNGAFKTDTNNKHLSINLDDYETLEDVMEKYNTIIGRRDILEKIDNFTSV
jgi:hypothetical protein